MSAQGPVARRHSVKELASSSGGAVKSGPVVREFLRNAASALDRSPVPVLDAPHSRSRKPRLLYLITRGERGGAQVHVLELALGMASQFDVEVATGEEGFLADACRDNRIPVHVIPSLGREIRPITDLRGFNQLVKLIRRLNPDLVHAHTFKTGFLGRLAAKKLNIPCVYTAHMWPFGRAVPLSWRLVAPLCERLAAKWCDRIISVSRLGVAIATGHGICEECKIASIWNGIPDHPSRIRMECQGDLRFVMVARFTYFKDHALLLRAFAQLPGNPCLLLIGDGTTLVAAKKLARDLGISERVDFVGSRSDVPELLAQSDVFILASKQETLPISILEAMRAGLPVIASDVGGISEEVIHGETGLLVTPGSVDSLAAAMKMLFENHELRFTMGRAGRQRFEDLFLSDAMIGRTSSLYNEILRTRQAQDKTQERMPR